MNAAPEKPEQGLPVFVADQLKQLIYNGELKPGERLNEAALALRMGTSRGPVREAIRMLTGLGLVTACLLYTSPSPRDRQKSRMPSSA